MPWDPEWSGDENPPEEDPFFDDAPDELMGDEFEPRSERAPSVASGERDPFFSETTHETGVAYYDAWRIEDLVRSGEIQKDGYRPGDPIRVTWESIDGHAFSTVVRLPFDWRRHDAWSDFYEGLREFFYPLWEDESGHEYDHEGGYVGEATGG